MKYTQISHVVLIGAGNIATHLASHLMNSKLKLDQIWSRTESSARTLGEKVQTPFTTSLDSIHPDADLYILALPDHALPQILAGLHLPRDRFIVHTAGGSPMGILSTASGRYGVFYPLQTCTRVHPVHFPSVPFCLEANSPGDLDLLKDFTRHFSDNIYVMDTEKRMTAHLAAVFVNNFTNYLYQVSEEILQKENLPFDLLKPLIRETAMKVQHVPPRLAQTGPAIRKDYAVLTEHLERLGQETTYGKLYSFLTQCILETYTNNSLQHDHAEL
ncbi:MAG: DUF2520 domain-containing protein [Bacteroidales bacterium]|nr:DUF2520 domain-containing protein [Bacteroidales bacterium]